MLNDSIACHIRYTMNDRLKLEELFRHSLLELNCIMCIHWMVYQMLYDNDNGIQSCTFGSDCAVANVIYGITNMRFIQGTGDTSGFKHFLRCENIKPGLLFDM